MRFRSFSCERLAHVDRGTARTMNFERHLFHHKILCIQPRMADLLPLQRWERRFKKFIIPGYSLGRYYPEENWLKASGVK